MACCCYGPFLGVTFIFVVCYMELFSQVLWLALYRGCTVYSTVAGTVWHYIGVYVPVTKEVSGGIMAFFFLHSLNIQGGGLWGLLYKK